MNATTLTKYVSSELQPFATYVEREDAVAVPTACMYPTNAWVTVYVRGGPNGAVVSDDGQAIEELTVQNREIHNPDRFLQRFCKRAGLEVKSGTINSPRIAGSQLPAAIAFVANASAEAVFWGMDKLRVRARRNLGEELERLLRTSLPKQTLEKDFEIEGKSARHYKFANAVRLSEKFVLIDPVFPEPSSINARGIAHMDVSQKKDDSIIQRLIYDDDEDWKAPDLNLLQMAATVVPYSRADQVVEDCMQGL